VVQFLGGIYSLVLLGIIVIPIVVCLAPLLPFVLLFLIGAGIDKLIGRVKRRPARSGRSVSIRPDPRVFDTVAVTILPRSMQGDLAGSQSQREQVRRSG
jgi:hypothetical protein